MLRFDIDSNLSMAKAEYEFLTAMKLFFEGQNNYLCTTIGYI